MVACLLHLMDPILKKLTEKNSRPYLIFIPLVREILDRTV